MSAHRSHALLRTTPRRSLSARGQLLHTFAGLGFGLAISMLGLGSYIIAEQFRDPVAANSAALLFGSVLIATAITLFYSFLRPSRKLRHRASEPAHSMHWEPGPIGIARSTTGLRIGNSRNLPLHARYVDHARVVIRS